MSIQTELTRITNAKAAVKAAIEGKGVTVPDGMLLDGMAPLIESIEAGGVGVQSDWNQNDETAPDYVKNRPFYTGNPVETILVEESTVSFAENRNGKYQGELPSTFEATVGETYKVYWDGAAYECTCVDFRDTATIGNLSIAGAGSDTGEPFIMVVDKGQGIAIGTADTSASHTFSICVFAPEVVKIDPKYLPDTIKSDVETAQSTAETAQATADVALNRAETAQATADVALNRADTAQATADVALNRANTAKTTADTAKTTADTAKTTADGCVKTNNSGLFQIYLGDNSYFSGSNTGGEAYYAFHQKNVTDTPIVLSIGTDGGTALDISVTPSTSPTVKITPPRYMNKIADIEIGNNSSYQRPQITGLGGITMYSSTSGSTKKFKITVDDSGTLKATEVS